MFSTDSRVILLAAAALIGSAGTALAQGTVVRAGGPSARAYPVGKSIAPSAKIALVAGDTLTVLDGRGTRTLRGPGSFNVSGAAVAPDKRGTFTSLISTQNRKQSRTGAVRGDGKPARSPNLWYVDVRTPATVCVADPAKIELWRPDMQKAQTLTVRNDASGKTGSAAWAMGKSSLAWPAAVPFADGASYTLSWSGATAPIQIRLVAFDPAAAGDPATLAEALHARGCAAQFDLLANSMEGAPAAP